jgi:TRAP-type mannitol/chloroaromatic compound transport system permease small subunit
MFVGSKIKHVLNLSIESLTQAFVVFAGFLIVVMAFAATYGAIRRYAFNSPESVSYEFSCIFLLISFVLAVPALEKQDRFIRCDILSGIFPKHARDIILGIISPILGLAFFGMVTWVSWGDAWHALQIGQVSQSAWPVPLFPIKLFIPIGYGLLCLILVGRLCLGLVSHKEIINRMKK